MEVLRILDPKVPVLGVCLGHQGLGLAAGAEVVVGPCIMHGKASEIVHDGSGLFLRRPEPHARGRYHSLVVRSDVDEAHAKFTVTAHGPEGETMASAIRIARGWASSSIRIDPDPRTGCALRQFPSRRSCPQAMTSTPSTSFWIPSPADGI